VVSTKDVTALKTADEVVETELSEEEELSDEVSSSVDEEEFPVLELDTVGEPVMLDADFEDENGVGVGSGSETALLDPGSANPRTPCA